MDRARQVSALRGPGQLGGLAFWKEDDEESDDEEGELWGRDGDWGEEGWGKEEEEEKEEGMNDGLTGKQGGLTVYHKRWGEKDNDREAWKGVMGGMFLFVAGLLDILNGPGYS